MEVDDAREARTPHAGSGAHPLAAAFGLQRSPLTPGGIGSDLFSPMSVLATINGHSGLRLVLPKDEPLDVDDDLCGSPDTPHFITAAAPSFDAPPKACPPTPYRPTRTPLARQDSLRDTKLLVATTASRRVSQTATTNAVAAAGMAAAAAGPGDDAAFTFESSFDFMRIIGKSPTSEVWLVRSRADGVLSAVKKSLAQFRGRADRTRYLREIQAAAALPEHPHCVRYYRCWQQDAHFFVQTELCAGGSLAGVLGALPQGALLPETDVWRLAREVAAGLAHCHAHGVLHLDVKPANVFLDDKATAKLGDFGLALLAGRDWESEEGDGGYVPPELLADDAAPTAAADVYSLGATLLEAAAGAPPPRGSYGAPVVLPPGRSEALRILLQAMLKPVPAERPPAAEVFSFAAAQLQCRTSTAQPRPMSARAAAAEPDGSGSAADAAQPPPQGAVLGLPAPRAAKEGDAPARVIDLSSGASVSLDALGPVVVNEDGTLARIGNWSQMTPQEQATTQRRISARNNDRLAALRAKQAPVPPLD